MNEKEKKAIEFLNFYKEHCLRIETENMKIGNYETVNDEGFVYKNLETVLNLIEKQQAEIEDCKKCVVRDDIHNYIEELEKKDKIIDLMAKDIKEADKFLDSMGYLGEYVEYTIEDIIEEYKKEAEYKIKEDK